MQNPRSEASSMMCILMQNIRIILFVQVFKDPLKRLDWPLLSNVRSRYRGKVSLLTPNKHSVYVLENHRIPATLPNQC